MARRPPRGSTLAHPSVQLCSLSYPAHIAPLSGLRMVPHLGTTYFDAENHAAAAAALSLALTPWLLSLASGRTRAG